MKEGLGSTVDWQLIRPEYDALVSRLLANGFINSAPSFDLYADYHGSNSQAARWFHKGNGVGTECFKLPSTKDTVFWANPPYTKASVTDLLRVVAQ